MLKSLNELFIKTLKLSPELWLYILIAIVGAAFLITLLIGLFAGEFKKIKSLMKSAIAHPQTAVAVMQKMPVGIKKQYKRARLGGVEPSMFVTEDMCVETPYKRSLIAKLWIVTFVATVVCAALAYVVTPLAFQTLKPTEAAEAFNINAVSLLPVTVLLIGGLLTLIGALVSRGVHVGAVKTYAKFVTAIDGGDNHGAAQQPARQEHPVVAPAFDNNDGQQTVAFAAQEQQAEPVVEQYGAYSDDDFGAEPVAEAEPVFAAEPVAMEAQTESEEELRQRAREEALMRARAEQEAQARAAEAQAQAQARAAAEAQAQAQARAAAEAKARAEAQARASQASAAKAQAQPSGSSSADDIIARIEQIDREGAPRETMREVATLLQKERAKPENKTPEQQKKLNEALSKLLKAMTAASRK